MAMSSTNVVPPRRLADHLLSHGHPVATLDEIAELTGLSPKAAAAALTRLKRNHALFSPHPGLYVAIPPEYRSWGVVPALDFIDPFMAELHRRYYVSLLSAAELYGAAHQRPQVFQVMVDRRVADRDIGRVRLRFYSRTRIDQVPTVSRNTATGQARIATPAATALDLANRPLDAGGLSNVATVLTELVEEPRLTVSELLAAAPAYPAASLQRLGWLLDRIDAPLDLARLADVVRTHLASGVALDPSQPRRGRKHPRWGVVENADVEPDT
jgi:predicted transcriptional regulator of viral defense system